MQAYLQPGWQGTLPDYEDPAPAPEPRAVAPGGAIDRTAKIYVGGRQVRPDSGYSRAVVAHDGLLIGEVGDGNLKDIRNAVEAARKAESWGLTTAHLRAQILYYVAENRCAPGRVPRPPVPDDGRQPRHSERPFQRAAQIMSGLVAKWHKGAGKANSLLWATNSLIRQLNSLFRFLGNSWLTY